MARILNFALADIARMQTKLKLVLPPVYVQFTTGYPFPDLAYVRSRDLIELYEMEAELVISSNDALRDPNLSMLPWRESYFAIGERGGDEAVFYLDTQSKDSACPVFALEPGAADGMRVADAFAPWADQLVQAMVQEDARCVAWHARQKRPWWQVWG